MANEYLVSSTQSDVLLEGPPAARVQAARVDALFASPESVSPVQVSASKVEVLHEASHDFATLQLNAIHLDALIDATTAIVRLDFADDLGESFGLIGWGERGGVFLSSGPKVTATTIEKNPFTPTLPVSQQELNYALDEQQKILREQHNKTQAGDTTFDFGLLLRTYPNQEFTLGSRGRFFHPEFGLIEARYCRLVAFGESYFQGQPVGRLKTSKSTKIDWSVTNDFSKSDPTLAAGFVFFETDPGPNEIAFGWVVISGANPVKLNIARGEALSQDTPVGWAATSALSVNFSGRELGRLWGGLAAQSLIEAGQLMIEVERWSTAEFKDLVNQTVELLTAKVGELAEAIQAGDENLDSLKEEVTELAAEVSGLETRIEREELARNRQYESLQIMYQSTDWTIPIKNAMDVLRTEYRQADSVLSRRLDQLSGNSGFDPSGLQGQIDSLAYLVGEIEYTAVQPATAANQIMRSVLLPPDPEEDAGSDTPAGPQYGWVPGDLALDEISDVSAPSPLNNQVLTWESSSSSWKAKTPSSGGGGGGGSLVCQWDFATDGASVYSPVGDLTGKNSIYVVVDRVTLAISGWRVVQFSTDGGATWLADQDWSTAVAAGTTNPPVTATDKMWFLHGTAATAARTAAGSLWGLAVPAPKLFRTARDSSGMWYSTSVINAVRVAGRAAADVESTMTGGRVYIWAS